MANKLQVRDSGIVIEATLKEGSSTMDLSSATTKEFVLISPDKSQKTKTAIFSNDGQDGKIRFTTSDKDFNRKGSWLIHAHIVTPSSNFRTDDEIILVD